MDLLIPAALGGVITEDNADKVKAKLIAEVANGPITSKADEILAKKNIVVLPDVLVNAGGVTVSWYEWVQNQQGSYPWTIEEVSETCHFFSFFSFLPHAVLCSRCASGSRIG